MIKFNTSHLFAHTEMVEQFVLIHSCDPNWEHHPEIRVDLRVIVMTEYATFCRDLGKESLHLMKFSVISRILISKWKWGLN